MFSLSNLFSDVKSGSQSLNMVDNDSSVEGKQIICAAGLKQVLLFLVSIGF